MFDFYGKLFDMLTQQEKRRFFMLMAFTVVTALSQLIGLSSIFLVLTVLTQPELIQTNGALAWLNGALGFETDFGFQLFLAVMTFFAFLLGIIARALGTYANARYANMRGYSIASRLLEGYLGQPYVWFLNRNSADITRKVLGEARALAGSLIAPALELLSSCFMVVVYLAFMLYLEPEISLVAAVLMFTAYLVTLKIVRPLVEDLGKLQVRMNKQAFRAVSEAGAGYKELKLHGLEPHYATRYRAAAFQTARAASKSVILNHGPRFVMEAVFFGLLLGIVIVFFLRGDGSLIAAVPTLGALGFSAMRLLPSLQAVYGGLTMVRQSTARLESVHSDYMANARHEEVRQPRAVGRLEFQERLKLENVGYSYPEAELPALKDFSLEIPVKTTVGIVGGTGAGKTTIVDLILGLLPASEGELSVDETLLTPENLRSWQQMVGYVPQSIFLIDDSVAQNIAFGIPKSKIDMDLVRHVAKVAALDTFIETELPDGYNTPVGERGARLSGGQRQRIGIARALYRQPKLLVMDEATSALDNITERVVMEAIHALRDDFTIILIAHRLSTVRECDNVVMMKHGRILAQGTYDALLKESEAFQELATGT